MDFERVWQDIIRIINKENSIVTLSRRHINTITEILLDGLMVAARGEPKLIKKEWIEATWSVLLYKRKITANDLPGTARYRSSFIMALLSGLEYVSADDKPNTLCINISPK